MLSLARVYEDHYELLKSQGLPDEVCKKKCNEFVDYTLNERLNTFSISFPGLTDRTKDLNALFDSKIAEANFNAVAATATSATKQAAKKR